jgi:hypothetical protein
MNPLRWLKDWKAFIRFYRAPKESGFFGMLEDDPRHPDLLGGHTKRRVFVSFARPSLHIARRLERALSAERTELTPWRYEPAGESLAVDTRSTENFVDQIDRFQRDHPGLADQLDRTLRRCVAYVFFVSPSSLRSAICSFEAFVVSRRFSGDRDRAPVWVIQEKEGLESPYLSGFRTELYRPGIEIILGSKISNELEVLGLDYPSRFM